MYISVGFASQLQLKTKATHILIVAVSSFDRQLSSPTSHKQSCTTQLGMYAYFSGTKIRCVEIEHAKSLFPVTSAIRRLVVPVETKILA